VRPNRGEPQIDVGVEQCVCIVEGVVERAEKFEAHHAEELGPLRDAEQEHFFVDGVGRDASVAGFDRPPEK
jgi:hypothetical protein